VFEKRVLKGIIELNRNEVKGDWRKLHNEELHNLYSSPRIITTNKSRMRWVGHVGRMWRRGLLIRIWWESQYVRDHEEGQDVRVWITIKWILEK
jgi:hypothetical protein